MFGNRISNFSLTIFLFIIFTLPSGIFAHGFGRIGGIGKIGKAFSSSGIGDPVIDNTVLMIFLILIVVGLIVIGLISWRFYKKSTDAKELSREIEKYDPAWNFKELQKHVIDTFYKVHEARVGRNQDIARHYITPSLYTTYKSHTDSLLARNYRPVFKRVHLDKVKIMGINDYQDDTKDAFWAYVKGSALDYHVDSWSKVISGNSSKPSHFREMWKFVRTPQGWKLDRRDPYVIWSLLEAESFTEGYGNLSRGYLFCGDCEGYYALEEGESPEDFDVCQCGGSLRYFEDVDELSKKNKKI